MVLPVHPQKGWEVSLSLVRKVPTSDNLDPTTEDVLTDEEYDAAMEIGPEDVVECTDPDAIAANRTGDPAGWPRDWNRGDELPDPKCHPDFIELNSWENLEKFSACWDGFETGALGLPADASEQEKYEIEWEASKDRKDWSFPKTTKPVEEGNPGCVDAWEKEFK